MCTHAASPEGSLPNTVIWQVSPGPVSPADQVTGNTSIEK